MVKKVVILATALALVLAVAQVALAQQNPDQIQTTDDLQTTGGGEPSASRPSPPDQAQQDASQSPPSGAEPEAATANLDSLMRLNKQNNLVIDCPAVADELTQLQGTSVGSPQDDKMLRQLKELSLLCTASGFTS